MRARSKKDRNDVSREDIEATLVSHDSREGMDYAFKAIREAQRKRVLQARTLLKQIVPTTGQATA
jgi:hypothetical protein